MSDDNKPVNIKTPKGIARFPHLTHADFEYQEGGVFSVKLVLDGDEASGLIETIDGLMEKSLAKAKSEAKNAAEKKKIKPADPPYQAVLDPDTGEETGEYTFTFKMYREGKRKDGSKFTRRPALFDGKGNKLPKGVEIGGGSTIRVAGFATLFFTKLVGAGVSLKLQAVKVIQLVEPGAGGDASAFGFDDDEGEDLSDRQADEPDEDEDDTDSDEADDEDEEDDEPEF